MKNENDRFRMGFPKRKLMMEVLHMYVTIADFIREWNKEALLTQKVLDGLTDHSLK